MSDTVSYNIGIMGASQDPSDKAAVGKDGVDGTQGTKGSCIWGNGGCSTNGGDGSDMKST